MILPSYTDDVSGITAPRIDALPIERRLSADGVAQFFGSSPSASATCFAGVKRLWDPLRTASPASVGAICDKDVIAVLRQAVAAAVSGAEQPVIALSGGIDSLVLALLLGEVLGRTPAAATLVTGIDGYCELDATARAADLLGLDLVELHADAGDIVDALPEAVRAAEVPMYNLHPVTKWLFARGAHVAGYDRILTGDGADQVIAHDPGVDYLPVVGSMFAASSAEVRWPFLDPAMVGVLRALRPDPDKSVLRRFVADRLGAKVAMESKRAGFTPPIDLARLIDPAALQRVAAAIDRPLPGILGDRCDDRTRCRWITLSLLAESHC